MKAPVYNLTGTKVKDLILDKDIFDAKINPQLVAQAIRVYQGNQRQASAKTLTRSQVDRTTKKVYRQKGTGNARHGSRKAPIYVGGGIAHGPRGNQNYSLTLSKKMKIAALKSALSEKAANHQIIIIEDLDKIKTPKTKTIADFLQKLDKDLRNIYFVINPGMENAKKSINNLSYASTSDVNCLTTYQVLKSKTLIISQPSLKTLKDRLVK